MEMIREKEEIKQKKLEVKEQTKEDNNGMSNMIDPYYEL